jgi:hypothetical protein
MAFVVAEGREALRGRVSTPFAGVNFAIGALSLMETGGYLLNEN